MHKHCLLYKPYGYISQLSSNDERQLRKKKFLKDLPKVPTTMMPVGRLDEKSEGLLMLTTSGQLSNTINKAGIEKEYWVLVDGAITDAAINLLKEGVLIGIHGTKYETKPCKVERITETPKLPERSKKIRDERHGPVTWLSITITEGKFRQIRKMTSAVGFPTLRLVRVRIGNLTLGELQPGDVIAINESSIGISI